MSFCSWSDPHSRVSDSAMKATVEMMMMSIMKMEITLDMVEYDASSNVWKMILLTVSLSPLPAALPPPPPARTARHGTRAQTSVVQ